MHNPTKKTKVMEENKFKTFLKVQKWLMSYCQLGICL